MKTSAEIFAHIDELNDAPEGAMPDSVKAQLHATRDHTIALLTIAGQIALIREANAPRKPQSQPVFRSPIDDILS